MPGEVQIHMYDDLVFHVHHIVQFNISFESSNPWEMDSPIQAFYKGQTVFITGATGFLGTLLVEKLLRCFPQIHKIILLIRNSRTMSVEERVRDFFSDEIFDKMKFSNPNYSEKVDIVYGQLEADEFGLPPSDLQLLLANTSIIFHVAATVRFDEHIRVSYDINVKGTQTLISLARRMPHLKSFVYVSTAYCNCERRHIDEKFYPPIFTADQLSTLVSSASNKELALLNDHIIGEKPNTYTLTKSTAEDLLREAASELSISVIRPSIVFPTLEEPMPLWMKGFNSFLALGLTVGMGLQRVVLCANLASVDIVPADRTINAIVAVAWYKSVCLKSAKSDRTVFNFVSYPDNKVLVEEALDQLNAVWSESGESAPSSLWKSHYYTAENFRLYMLLFYVLHFVPALAFSLGERLTHRKPRVVKLYRKMFHFSKVIRYFSVNEWQFENHNTHKLLDAMSKADKVQFDCSMSNFLWNSLLGVGVHRAISLYMLKETVSKEEYKKRMFYIEWIDYCIWMVIKLIVLYIILAISANLINTLM